MRDMFNHEMTVPDQWRMLILPNHYTKHEMRYGRYVPNATTVTPHYDPMCATIEKGCYPVRIISAEKLVVPDTGPAEGRKIAELIKGKEGFDEWMIDEEVCTRIIQFGCNGKYYSTHSCTHSCFVNSSP